MGLELTDRGIAREQNEVWDEQTKVGYVTSGTMAPYLGKAVAMALVNRSWLKWDSRCRSTCAPEAECKSGAAPFRSK